MEIDPGISTEFQESPISELFMILLNASVHTLLKAFAIAKAESLISSEQDNR